MLGWPLTPQADSACYYDGVSQTSLDHILLQISRQFDIAVIADRRGADDPWLAQPLGPCSLTDFMTLATAHSNWRFRQNEAGVVLYYQAREPSVSAPERADEPEELVVTGVQFLLTPSLANRYASHALDEAAMLPRGQLSANNDLTASLGRLAAVTFSQEAGMDRNISVRGMNSDFTRVLVNGMPMLATSASIDARGAVNNSRSFDFNVLPQGLFNQISISKSRNARGMEGAIGGTVDLRTPMPFDRDASPTRWFNALRETNVSNQTSGVALAGGFEGISDDGEFGWLLAFSGRHRTTRERGYSTVRWQAADWGSQPRLSQEQQDRLDSGEVFSPRHNRYDLLNRELTTYGLSVALQWRRGRWGDVDLTLMGARHQQVVHEYHITSAGLKTQDLSHIQVNDFELGSKGMMYGSFSGVDVRTEHNWQEDDTDLGQIKLDWRLPLAPRWALQSSLGYQASMYHSPRHDKVSLLSPGQDFSFDLRADDRMSVNRYGFDIADPSEWQLYRINRAEDRVTNRYQVAALEVSFDQDWLTHYVGIQGQRFSNQRSEAEYTNEAIAGSLNGFYQLTPGNFARGPGPSGLPERWVVGDHQVIAALGLDKVELERDPTQQRTLQEQTGSAWWQTSFDIWPLVWPIRGDVGVRYSVVNQSVEGHLLIDDQIRAVDVRTRHHNWLPSLHLVAQARDDVLLRFGYSRDLVNPSIDALTTPLLIRSSARIVDSGNPELQPLRSHAFDGIVEWYGPDRQFVALGVFYNRIDSLVVERVEEVTLDQLPYYNPQWDDLTLVDGVYDYRRPVNGPGTDITGFEVNFRWPLTGLPAPLNRFGVDGSYAFSRAFARYPVDGGDTTLPPPGFSRHVTNAALWYQGNRVSVGVTLRGRSPYLTRVPGSNGNDIEGVNASLILGAYASWLLNDEWALSLDAKNLTNEPFDQFVDSSNRVYSYSTTGTDVSLGINWRFTP